MSNNSGKYASKHMSTTYFYISSNDYSDDEWLSNEPVEYRKEWNAHVEIIE